MTMQAEAARQTPVRVLMVCLGNICRSPTAEVVLRAHLRAAGLEQWVEVDSAGTSDWHTGEAPDTRSMHAAAERLYDMSNLRARQVCTQDFEVFDHIYAMDQQNLEVLQELCPLDLQHKLELLLNYGHTGWQEVPDPFNTDRDGFDLVLDLSESACADLVSKLQLNYRLASAAS